MSNPFLSAYSQSDLFGKTIFFSLFAISIITWCLIIYKIWLQRRLSHRNRWLKKQFNDHQQRPLALNLKNVLRNPFWEIYCGLRQLCLQVLEKNRQHAAGQAASLSAADMELIHQQIDTLVARQARRLETNLYILSTVVTLAPFLGLLGTVWGSLLTLSALQGHHALGGNSLVLEGLSMALATTVLGLVVAIPALVGHNYLKTRLRDLTRDMQDFAAQVIGAIEMRYRQVDLS